LGKGRRLLVKKLNLYKMTTAKGYDQQTIVCDLLIKFPSFAVDAGGR
jgi:hypothetical protein